MLAKSILKCLVILVLFVSSECGTVKYKRKTSVGNSRNTIANVDKGAMNETGRGLFFRGGLLSFSKVVNFFPVGGERECQPEGYHVARAGICLNAYDCRQRDGKAAGDCAHGLGVCCVFEATCGGVIQNNLTYFMSPGFPELWGGDQDCDVTIEKAYEGIMQLRIDFVHFTIGQPNRQTGECDEDAMILGDDETKFVMCGQNHGQHIYYTLSSNSASREADDIPSSKATKLSMRMRGGDMPRLWLMRIAQMPLAVSAPHGCLQHYTADNGTIKTFNFASNGRHLASQDYKACVRRNKKFCSIRYSPCDQRSFRIGSGEGTPEVIDPVDYPDQGPGSAGGPGTGFYGPEGALEPIRISTTQAPLDQVPEETMNVTTNIATQPPAQDMQPQDDDIEGSGEDPQIEPATNVEKPGFLQTMWSNLVSWMWGQRSSRGHREGRSFRWSPYVQHLGKYSEEDNIRYFGYGNFGGLKGFGRQRCEDRITIPCENEYFVSSEYYNVGVCDPHHCGRTFCPGQNINNCWVETSIAPFTVSVHFGPPTVKKNPEENIGMCLKYTQLPCDN